MVGVTPLWGLHLWIVLAIGLPLRLDVPIAYLAANISIPPLLPLITGAEIEVGAMVRTGRFIRIARADIAAHGVGAYIKDLWIGTALLGPVIALIGSFFTFVILTAKRVHAHKRALERGERDPDPMNRVADRYAHGSVGTRMYVSSKLHADPVGAALLARGPYGAVLDFGCGRGQLALLLLEAGVATRVVGVDWDQEKVDEANRAATGLDAAFRQGDVRTAEIDETDTVMLIDVLHYFAIEEQIAILKRAARAAKSRVVIRDIDPDRGWRSTMTRLQERITTRAKYNKGERVLPRSIADVTRDLEAEGFRVEVVPCWGSTPFSNVLVVATRV